MDRFRRWLTATVLPFTRLLPNHPAFEHASFGIAFLTGERFVRTNLKFCEMLGYSQEELSRLKFTDVTHPEDVPDSLLHLEDMLAGKLPVVAFDKRYIRKDGSTLWAAVTVSLLTLDRSVTDLRMVVIKDIGEKVRHEQALVDQRNKLEAALASMTDAVVVTDPEGRFVNFNEAFATFHRFASKLDFANSVARAPVIFELRTPDGALADLDAWPVACALRGESMAGAEFVVSRADTGESWIGSYNYSPFYDTDGAIAGSVIIARDITGQRKAEEALASYHTELEKMVEVRTRAAEAARAEAERANDVKTRFLAAASHDLRQPLQAAHSYLGALSATELGPEARNISDALGNAIKVLSGLVDNMLDMSRLQSGQLPLVLASFSLSELLHQVAGDHLPAAEAKGLELRVEVEPAFVNSDHGLLTRLVQNLLSNAIAYTPRGHVTLQCACEAGVARVRIVDSGIGIPAHLTESVFDEYMQIGNPSRDPRQGQGLGLSIVRSIVKLLGLELAVESVVGRGTTFSFCIPLAGEPAPYIAVTELAIPADGAINVLLVEDDPAVRDSTAMLLQSFGFSVTAAETAAEACLKAGDETTFDVILTDYRLPDASGLDVVNQLRRVRGAELPAIIITGETRIENLLDARTPNCEVMSKPVAFERLMATIRRMVDTAPR